MYSTASSVYSLKLPARSLASVSGDTERHRFLAGTCSLREANELQLLNFQEETNEISCIATFYHPEEIWGISASPSDRRLALTCHNNNGAGRGGTAPKADKAFGVSLWRLPQDAGGNTGGPNSGTTTPDGGVSSAGAGEGSVSQPLEKVTSLGFSSKAASAMLWEPGGQGERVVTVAGYELVRWELGGGAAREAARTKASEGTTTSAACWDPHNKTSIAVATGSSLRLVDTRTGGAFTAIAQAHRYACRDVDYNPHKANNLITCGEDRLLRFWDLRSPGKPLKSILAHKNHWVTTARYNKFHDLLLATGGSDNNVCLWRVPSLSSSPMLDLLGGSANSPNSGGGTASSPEEAGDVRVKTYDDHEASVYSVAWSAHDAWSLASLSYSGRVVIHHVPVAEKYKILL